jgi:hypothetical protein
VRASQSHVEHPIPSNRAVYATGIRGAADLIVAARNKRPITAKPASDFPVKFRKQKG